MPRVIKRYSNRKLYDVHARRYISLEELGGLVRGGETVQVVDNATGEDITSQTLTLVILEEGKRGPSLLPTDMLHSLLRRGEQVLDEGLGAVRSGVEGVRHGVERVGSILPGLPALPTLPVARREEIDQLRDKVAEMEATLARLLDEKERKPAARKRGKRQ
jgi:polyhydroxyalkanoate synthesis repressor PhaR